MSGDRHASRVGASILGHTGFPEWVATSPASYIETAVHLARHTDKLSVIRQGLRKRILSSALCDYESFANGIETAYRSMWDNYSSKQ